MHIIKIDPDFTPETHTIGGTSAQSSAITTQSGLIRISVKGTHAHVFLVLIQLPQKIHS
jgi:hypothetical protein